MLRINITAENFVFNPEALQKEVMAKIFKQVRLAAAEFVKASVPRVPVDTGMARGSFLNLIRALKNAGIPVELPSPLKRVSKRKKPVWYYQDGKRFRKQPLTGQKFSETTLKMTASQIVFNFKSKLLYYAIMDFYNVNGHGPWESFEAGRQAFLAKMDELKTAVPDVTKFLTKTEFSTRGGVRIRKQGTR